MVSIKIINETFNEITNEIMHEKNYYVHIFKRDHIFKRP